MPIMGHGRIPRRETFDYERREFCAGTGASYLPLTLVVVTVMFTVAVAPPVPETRYVHTPAVNGANVKGPLPVAGVTLAIPPQFAVVSPKVVLLR
jgi:hypothetical protein